ncbi:MAG: hypothetical protein ACI88H_002523 [Cocleimonas sp.]|jgi:hypothetical protein
MLLLSLLTLTGCSTIDSYRTPNQSAVRGLPQIPEIKRQTSKSQTTNKRYIPPQKTVARAPAAPGMVIKSHTKTIVETSKVPQLIEQQQLEQKKLLQQQAKKNATVDIDPYATIPESSANQKAVSTPAVSSSKTTLPSANTSSPAVRTLMTSARADIALGRSRSAVSKLERGLRIEPQNAHLWHMLAKAHYSNSAYLHSISIAKKSNANTNNSDLINENWKLIKLAGERSGNASAIKEALDYMKVNP